MNKLYIILLSLAIVCSCENEAIPQIPEIKLTENESTVSSEGGKIHVTYSLLNAKESDVIIASFDKETEWITIDNSERNIITLFVSPNESLESREADIRISVSGIQGADKIFSLKQLGKEEEPQDDPEFAINISEIGIETATVSIIPQDLENSYTAMCISVSDYEQMGDDESMYKALVDRYWEMAVKSGLPISEYLKTYILYSGEQTLKLDGLSPDTEYYVLAVGMDENAAQTSPMVKEKFCSEKIEMNGATFQFQIDMEECSADLTVIPSSNDIYYCFDALKKSAIEASGKSIEENLRQFLDSQIQYSLQLGISREETMLELASKGPDSFLFENLHSSSTYCAFAISVTLQGYFNSELSVEEFDTPAIEMSDNKLDFMLSDIGVDRVNISITTTNDDPYALIMAKKSEWAGTDPSEIAKEIATNANIDNYVTTGDREGDVTGLIGGTEYYALLFGYRNGTVTTEVIFEQFTTLEEGNPEELTITYDVENLQSNSATVTIKPEPKTALYFGSVINALATDEEIFAQIDHMAEIYVGFGLVKDKADFLKKASVRGDTVLECDDLYASTEYKVIAIGIYSDTGEYATGVINGGTFVTKDRQISSASIELMSENYYNGDEVYQKYPEFEVAKGRAVVPVKVKVSENTSEYYYHLFLGDFSDIGKNPDDAVIEVLTTQGGITKPEETFFCEYDKTYTMLAVAKDESGIYGKVYRKKVVYTQKGCSPIDGFVPPVIKSNAVPLDFESKINFEMTQGKVSDVINLNNNVSKTKLNTIYSDKVEWGHLSCGRCDL